jgi:hypothetical protein
MFEKKPIVSCAKRVLPATNGGTQWVPVGPAQSITDEIESGRTLNHIAVAVVVLDVQAHLDHARIFAVANVLGMIEIEQAEGKIVVGGDRVDPGGMAFFIIADMMPCLPSFLLIPIQGGNSSHDTGLGK